MKPVLETTIFPAKHHVTSSTEQFEEALSRIQDELVSRVKELKAESKHFEADRLLQRVSQDLQLLRETGTCSGVENYSRHMGLREAGEAPDTLLDYFGSNDWLLLVDESHVTLPQLKAMYGGDRSRKERLVKHGFRLPSALDNRPLKENEFWGRISQSVFVSATPSKQEMSLIEGINQPIDMIIRPTYICDPEISVRPKDGQLNDLLAEIGVRASRNERVLVMALTKRDAEDLADYLKEHLVSATYIHSGLNTHERSEALKALQSGEIDCLVGVNLLREGLDLPQVSLVAVLNADSEGFLRSETALLQTIGRAARNIHGTAILYASRVTDSMKRCIDATNYRRQYQLEYNAKHGKKMRSTQGSSVLSIFDLLKDEIEAERPVEVAMAKSDTKTFDYDPVPVMSSSRVLYGQENRVDIVTDHIPSKPGVYFWKDLEGNNLYIGKAKRLRSRVKSYLSPKAKHTSRIQAMLKKAVTVEFILTPSEGDALLLENKLIKHHQPIYNVLLKDDTSFPYICATIGDALPQLTIAPSRQEGERASKYRYFGPYPRFSELHAILQAIEDKYDLRSNSFQARYGDVSKAHYQQLFQKVISEVFDNKGPLGQSSLPTKSSIHEEPSNLFESRYNKCRDVVAVGHCATNERTYIVYVLQLREGLVSGRFSYTVEVQASLVSSMDFGDVIQTVLEQKHYPAGERVAPGQFSFFPDEVLTQYPLNDAKVLRETIRTKRNEVEPERMTSAVAIRVAASKGERHEADKLALQCAMDNAAQVADERSLTTIQGVPMSSIDGTAALELADLLSLDDPPQRIECYDISHTQGEGTVASRVVFLNGRPATDLYRRFNIQSVEGVDDYASLEEVLERRFRRVWVKGEGGLVDQHDPWAKPDLVVIDGGKGQLTSALKGMAKANVFPPRRGKTSRLDETTSSSAELGDFFLEEEYYANALADNADRHIFVPIVSLAKNKEDVFAVNSSTPVNDRPDSAALLLLRAIRDESHRFALRSHRKRRSKANGL
jgi:excinuclease UvrABC nuclease subunit